MEYKATLLMSGFVTHDVKLFIISRPDDFSFTPGDGVGLAIDEPAWRDEARPFTPTSLIDDSVVEFTRQLQRLHKLDQRSARLNTTADGRYATRHPERWSRSAHVFPRLFGYIRLSILRSCLQFRRQARSVDRISSVDMDAVPVTPGICRTCCFNA